MFEALDTGLKIGNHSVVGDLQGHTSKAAGGCGVNLICEGKRTAKVALESRQV